MAGLEPPETRCPCTRRHAPTPARLERWHIIPLDHGGADVPENEIWVCPTAAVNIEVFLNALLRYGMLLPRGFRRRFTRFQQEVALVGYRGIIEHRANVEA